MTSERNTNLLSVITERFGHVLEVWGDFACFTRPDLKVERYSYPLPTPSAARGVFEAVYFKPEFYWQITRIVTINAPSYIALRRNEVKDKVSSRAVQEWMSGKSSPEPLWADGDKALLGTDMKGRTQRQTIALRSPRISFSPAESSRVPAMRQSQHRAYDEQFVRRAKQGKCFQQPALGSREFVAFFRLISKRWMASPLLPTTRRTWGSCSTTFSIFAK